MDPIDSFLLYYSSLYILLQWGITSLHYDGPNTMVFKIQGTMVQYHSTFTILYVLTKRKGVRCEAPILRNEFAVWSSLCSAARSTSHSTTSFLLHALPTRFRFLAQNLAKLGYTQQDPNTHMWLLLSHSTDLPLILSAMLLYVLLNCCRISASCFSSSCTSSNNSFVTLSATFFSNSVSLCWSCWSFSSSAYDSWRASSCQGWVLSIKLCSSFFNSSIFFCSSFDSLIFASLYEIGKVFVPARLFSKWCCFCFISSCSFWTFGSSCSKVQICILSFNNFPKRC